MTRLQVDELSSDLAGPFSFTLEAGQCLAITGQSGSGKTLLLRLVADLDPGTGRVALDGSDRAGMPAHEWRRQVVYCAAEAAWWDDHVSAHFNPFPTSEAARLGLRAGLADARVAACSTGERQRLALLRALALRPKVLLLDEPTASLDEASAGSVEAVLLAELRRGTAIVLVTHAEEQAERLASERRRIVHGRFEA